MSTPLLVASWRFLAFNPLWCSPMACSTTYMLQWEKILSSLWLMTSPLWQTPSNNVWVLVLFHSGYRQMFFVQESGSCMATIFLPRIVSCLWKLIMLRMGSHSQVVFYNKMWSILNYLRNVVAQMVIRYSQFANHQKIFMFLNGFRNKFVNGKAFAKAETLFCLYYVWSPFEWQTLSYTGASIRGFSVRTKEHVRNWILCPKNHELPTILCCANEVQDIGSSACCAFLTH